MITLDLSGTTHLSADHNVALTQVLNRSIRLNMHDLLIAVYSSSTRTSNSQILPQQILLRHGNSSIHNKLPPLVMSNTTGTSLELKSRSSHGQEIALLCCRENTQLPASSRFSSNVNSSHLTGINRKSHSGQAQRYQSRSEQRRKSTAIYRRRLKYVNNTSGQLSYVDYYVAPSRTRALTLTAASRYTLTAELTSVDICSRYC
ncbi:hypothetical protein F511_31361 [Dorcoceras hygrometricum]|uniref:Uncharacterized protein n=1 Tax=Dorcoceras hygrometricum TaxID=472368 RepID=A0A2Z7AFY5_9LAMI|nr:hypothetical protein F511_31361 [Dorcoceras hygrometricum]